MAIKNILLLFSGGRAEVKAMDLAFQWAVKYNAQIKVLHISPNPKDVLAHAYSGIGLASPSIESVTDEIENVNFEKEELANDTCVKYARKYSVSFTGDNPDRTKPSVLFCHEVGSEVEKIISRYSRVSDIVIMSRAIWENQMEYAGSINSILYSCGRPVVFVPKKTNISNIGSKIAVAFDGGLESSKALQACLSIADGTEQFYVLSINERNKDTSAIVHGAVEYLESHSLNVEPLIAGKGADKTGKALLREAKEVKADLLVMGALTHNRLRQMVIGGTTKFMMDKADIPVLMVH